MYMYIGRKPIFDKLHLTPLKHKQTQTEDTQVPSLENWNGGFRWLSLYTKRSTRQQANSKAVTFKEESAASGGT